MATDADGNIYVADSLNARIQKFTPQGEFLQQWGTFGSLQGFLALPSGLAFTGDSLFVADSLNHRVQVFSTTGHFLYQFGRHPNDGHQGLGRMHYPYGIATSPNGQFIAIVEPNENRVQLFLASDMVRFVAVNDDAWWNKGAKFHYGRRVSGHIGFSPGDEGIIAVSEPDTSAVLIFDQTSELPRYRAVVGGYGELPGQLIEPTGVALRPGGITPEIASAADYTLVVSDSGNRRLQTWDVATTTRGVTLFGAPADAPVAQPASPTVRLSSIVDLNGPAIAAQVAEFASAPRQSASIIPSAVKLGPDGLLYLLDPYNGQLVVMSSEFSIVRTIGRGETVGTDILLFPLDFAFSVDGQRVYFTDAHGARVVVFGIGGEYLFTIGGHISTMEGPTAFVDPFGIAGGVNGHVYVTDVGLNRLFKFSEDGALVRSWGEWGVGPNEYYKPKGIWQAADGRLYVIDFGNHRGQLLNADGEYLGEFGITDGSLAERP